MACQFQCPPGYSQIGTEYTAWSCYTGEKCSNGKNYIWTRQGFSKCSDGKSWYCETYYKRDCCQQ